MSQFVPEDQNSQRLGYHADPPVEPPRPTIALVHLPSTLVFNGWGPKI